MKNRQPTRFSGLVIMLGGGGLLIFAAFTAFQCARMESFHACQGMVVSKMLDSTTKGRISFHRPVIEYAYVVSGTEYHNSTLSLVDDHGTEEWANSFLQNYNVGATCTVYYDPLKPEFSVLVRRPSIGTILMMFGYSLFGLCLLISGTAIIHFASLRKPSCEDDR